jgi:uncharacterized membrane protein YhfC
MVPVTTLVVLALCALVGIAVPILLGWWMFRKYQVKPAVILIGAGTFILFALVLEALLHQLVLKGPYGSTIIGNTWYYALYGGLAAGLFEETGRFLAMQFLLKKEPSAALTGVAYGVGHGGAEMLIVYGLAMVSNLAMAAMINTGQAETLLSSSPGEAKEQLQAVFTQLQTGSAGVYLLGIWERASALILHLGLSLMVWTAVRNGGRWLWLFPAAILLHALADGCAVILNKSAGVAVTEAVLFAMAIAIGAMGWLLSRKLRPEGEPSLP